MAKIHPALARALKVYYAGPPKGFYFPSEKEEWKKEQIREIQGIVERFSDVFLFRDWYLSSFVFEDDDEKLIHSYRQCAELAEKFHEVMLVILHGIVYIDDHHGPRNQRLKKTLHDEVVGPLLKRYHENKDMPKGDRKEFMAFWKLLPMSPCLWDIQSLTGGWMVGIPDLCGILLYPQSSSR